MRKNLTFALFICILIACKERKPLPVVSPGSDIAATAKNDSAIEYLDYSYALAFSEGEIKNRTEAFKQLRNSDETKAAYEALSKRIEKKYNFASVDYCGKYMPANELFLLSEPDSITYRCNEKEYLRLLPRHDSVRKEIINELHKLSPLYNDVSFRFHDSASNTYLLSTTMDTLYRDYIPNPTIYKKIVLAKTKLQAICNWLTQRYKAYSNVQAKTYLIKKGGRTCTYVEFDIPLDSTKKAMATKSMFRVIIPELTKKVKAASPDFQRIYLTYEGYFYKDHIDTAFNISCNQ